MQMKHEIAFKNVLMKNWLCYKGSKTFLCCVFGIRVLCVCEQQLKLRKCTFFPLHCSIWSVVHVNVLVIGFFEFQIVSQCVEKSVEKHLHFMDWVCVSFIWNPWNPWNYALISWETWETSKAGHMLISHIIRVRLLRKPTKGGCKWVLSKHAISRTRSQAMI